MWALGCRPELTVGSGRFGALPGLLDKGWRPRCSSGRLLPSTRFLPFMRGYTQGSSSDIPQVECVIFNLYFLPHIFHTRNSLCSVCSFGECTYPIN